MLVSQQACLGLRACKGGGSRCCVWFNKLDCYTSPLPCVLKNESNQYQQSKQLQLSKLGSECCPLQPRYSPFNPESFRCSADEGKHRLDVLG